MLPAEVNLSLQPYVYTAQVNTDTFFLQKSHETGFHWLVYHDVERIRSFPLKSGLPRSISAMIQPTDQMSTARHKKQQQQETDFIRLSEIFYHSKD